MSETKPRREFTAFWETPVAKYVQLRPGERVISREEFRKLAAKHALSKLSGTYLFDEIEKELFGEGGD